MDSVYLTGGFGRSNLDWNLTKSLWGKLYGVSLPAVLTNLPLFLD